MSLISISNLSFTYPGSSEPVFSSVTLQLDTCWRLGLIGRNGRGKTTLLQLLMGRYPYRGNIFSSVEFDYFPFPVPDTGRTAWDVACETANITENGEEWRLYREISLLELPEELLSHPFSTLSGGEQTKLLLCSLFLRENHFLLIDEPTNHLDREGRALASKYLRRKQGFILVSHDRDFLDGCIDHVLSINRADIQLQRGNYSSWLQNRERQDQFERAESQKLKKDIHRLGDAARRSVGWSQQSEKGKYGVSGADCASLDRGFVGHKAAKMMKRAKQIQARQEKAMEEKQSLLKNIELSRVGDLAISPLRHHCEKLVECERLSVCYDAKPVFQPVSFTLRQGECLVLRGRNGCGKSSLLKLLSGQKLTHTGTLRLASGLTISVLPQTSEGLQGSLRDFARERGVDETRLLTVLRKFGFSREQFEIDLELYSAGQKRKVLLGTSLCQSAHLYLWDEPLNYLDILSRQQLEALITEYRPSMLLVEHDAAFCRAVGSGEVWLKRYQTR